MIQARGLTGDDRQIWGVTTLVTRTEASVDWSWWQNIISSLLSNSVIMQHSYLGHCSAAACRRRTLVYCHRMLVTTCGDAPGVWPPLTGCCVSGPALPGCDVSVSCSGPAQPRRVAARARALHQSWADQLSVTHREASSGHAEYSQVSALYTLRRQAIPRGILSHFLHFCILLICQYLLSADKHRPQLTKEVLVRTAPIELY